jgi:hypothetical protein
MHSSSVKRREFHKQLGNYKLLKKESAPSSYNNDDNTILTDTISSDKQMVYRATRCIENNREILERT